MLILYAMLIGFALDLLFGDPAWLPHPVVWMGRYISGYERRVRPLFPKTPRGELWSGTLLAVSLPLLSFALARGVCLLARRLHPAAELAVQSFWCAQALAARGLDVLDDPVDLRGRERVVGAEDERADDRAQLHVAVGLAIPHGRRLR